jgi:hypothetical protein
MGRAEETEDWLFQLSPRILPLLANQLLSANSEALKVNLLAFIKLYIGVVGVIEEESTLIQALKSVILFPREPIQVTDR